jgi:hypothetical protein
MYKVFQKVRRMINSTLVGIPLLVPASNIAYSSKEQKMEASTFA